MNCSRSDVAAGDVDGRPLKVMVESARVRTVRPSYFARLLILNQLRQHIHAAGNRFLAVHVDRFVETGAKCLAETGPFPSSRTRSCGSAPRYRPGTGVRYADEADRSRWAIGSAGIEHRATAAGGDRWIRLIGEYHGLHLCQCRRCGCPVDVHADLPRGAAKKCPCTVSPVRSVRVSALRNAAAEK